MKSKGAYLKWDIVNLNQSDSRQASSPQGQPADPSKPFRPYLVIGTIGPGSHNVTVCPIQNNTQGRIFLNEVALSKGYGGFINKDCKILCSEIYTVMDYHFTNKIGELLLPEHDQVDFRLKRYLKL